jgi:AraC family transcriptional regulator, regulatory protein of adaptative response / DNA-3-methyladenine glycosylase II
MELDARVCDRARLARDARFDGRFFIAVLSTGIYCRPICPSPTARSENVRYFRSAAEAAAAGFRACLRCRPEAAPGTPRWSGTASTVRRALRLIEEGALQEESLAALARRLGVSARQLHRLFTVHLGASPIAVAKTWRLSFARQLLRETDMPMSRVALAAGFRTVRRFNDAIRAVYGRTPSELRRRRPPASSRAGRDEYVFRLPYRPPFDWESLLRFLGARSIAGVEEVASGAYRRTFVHEGRAGVLEVEHDARASVLMARVRSAEPVALLPIVTRLRGLFDLTADPSIIARHFRTDPLLGPLVARRPGLRVPGAWDPFETWIRAALGERMAGSTSGAVEALANDFGERLPARDGSLTTLFPAPDRLAGARLDGLPPARARAIRALAAAAASGSSIAGDGDDREQTGLAHAAGLSATAVQYVAFRASRQPDAFPADDPALQAAGPGIPRTAAALETRAERWRPWRAYAAIHLWRAAADRVGAARQRAAV